jgi:cation diffusion facilitator family transporter
MSAQRRTALASVVAAAVLVAVKLTVGLTTNSLGLVSEAAHSGTDLVAAILTLYAVGVAIRPADTGHPYGHGKAEHLAALAEATFLAVVSVFIGARAIERLTSAHPTQVDAAWYALLVVGVVIIVDATRMVTSLRTSRRYGSPALASNALHFASDLAGSAAVLLGLVAVRAGYHDGDSVAALFVAVLVLVAAAQLARRNVDVLMDRDPAQAHETARRAISTLAPGIELRRLRMRQAAGRHFADVVIGVSPSAAVGQGHAAADDVESAVKRALPGADVVVHVEPRDDERALRDRAHAAALEVPRVREIHNISVLSVGGDREVSLHLKLPGDLSLEEAHELADDVERAIKEAVPEVESVQTHLEPLAEEGEGRTVPSWDVEGQVESVERVVREETGEAPKELRFLHTDEGLVAFLTLALDAATPLAEAHGLASRVEERVRKEQPEIADVIVHTEP